MGERTRKNLFEAFVGEAKAHIRLQAFAERAERDGFPQVAKLFRAIAEAERVHALNHLRLLGEAAIKSTEENLEYSFNQERTVNSVYYPQFIKVAEEEGDRAAALSFTHAMDVEAVHGELYEKAMRKLLRTRSGTTMSAKSAAMSRIMSYLIAAPSAAQSGRCSERSAS
jgi:rubrerythrin